MEKIVPFLFAITINAAYGVKMLWDAAKNVFTFKK